jgi:hypothetical protein
MSKLKRIFDAITEAEDTKSPTLKPVKKQPNQQPANLDSLSPEI